MRFLSKTGLPVRSALTMEYQNRKSVLRKGDPTAMVFDETVGGPAVSPSGQTYRDAASSGEDD